MGLVGKVRVVIVGTGHLGSYHIDKMLACTGAILVGLVEPNAARAAAALTRIQRANGPTPMPVAATVAAFSQAADAAIIATPTTSHLEVAKACFAKGWHVLVEKPLAQSALAAQSLVQAGADAHRLIQVGHLERFNPAVVVALAQAGIPRYIVAERLGAFTGRATDVDVVLDLMIHDLDLVAAHVGAQLVEARAVGVPVLTDTIDMAAARLTFANGTVAQFSAGRTSIKPSRKLRLFTQSGYTSVDCMARTVQVVRRQPPAHEGDFAQISGEQLQVPPGDALAAQDDAFIQAVRGGTTPLVDGEAGLRAVVLAEAVKLAMAQHAATLPTELSF
jgi:predicted dehydrogenase